jgi:hypothetical protein
MVRRAIEARAEYALHFYYGMIGQPPNAEGAAGFGG